MELIRLRACDGLCARDVIAAMGTSRRLAELRFREVVGMSILAAIQRQRVEQAKWQLQHSASLVADIAARCGYRSVRALRKVFVRETGMSPADWRRQGSH
jgi:AraC-like DNA-binding protein